MSSKSRPAHHVDDSRALFQNYGPSAATPTWEELASRPWVLGWYPSEPDASVIRQIKLVKPDWGAKSLEIKEAKRSKFDYLIATWLGHAGAMVEFPSLDVSSGSSANKESNFILFDPIFSFRAGPTIYTGPARLQESPCHTADLPGCHAVFISHNHYDHLDLPTVLEILGKYPDTTWFVPLGNKAWFLATGVKEERVVELDWWGTWEGNFDLVENEANPKRVSSMKVTSVPAQHNSGRTGLDRGTTLWCGWVVERFVTINDDTSGKPKTARKGSVYHAGDTGYRRFAKSEDVCPAFKEIGTKFGTLDVSFIPIWRGGSLGIFSWAGLQVQHQQIPSTHHCSPEDAIAIHRDVNSRNTIAIHFGTFVGSEVETKEALKEFYGACEASNVKDLESEERENGRAGTLDIGGSFVIDID